MKLNFSENKITFIVDTLSSFSFPKSGGSIATHKLAYELANRGHHVYIFNEPLYKHENIQIIPTKAYPKDDGWHSNFQWEGFSYNPQKTVSVYTQITWGNPFNTKHVARWILHDYDPEIWKTYGENEFFFNYANFVIPNGINAIPLTILDYGFDKYINLNKDYRKGFGHIIHKYTPEWGHELLERLGSTEIPNHVGRKDIEYFTEEFNKFEYILTFDYKSYLTIAATLCGTKAIILNPDPNLTPSEFRQINPLQVYGIAYGLNDIKHADTTINLVKTHLIEMEKRNLVTIDSFINFWIEKTK